MYSKCWSYHFCTTLPNFRKNDPETFWRHLSNTKKTVDQIKVNVFTCDHGKISHYFNAYFQSVFHYPDPHEYNDDPSFSNAGFISSKGVYSKSLNLKVKASCGLERMLNAFLLHYAEILTKLAYYPMSGL